MTGLQQGPTRAIRTLTKLRNSLVSRIGNNSKAAAHYDIILQRLFFFRLLSALGVAPSGLVSNEFSQDGQSPIVSLTVHGSRAKNAAGHHQEEIVRAVSSLGLFESSSDQQLAQQDIDHGILLDFAGALDDLEIDGPTTTAPIDNRILLLGLLYESIKSRRWKKRGGAFYTPFEIARWICSRSLAVFLEDWTSASPSKLVEQILSLRVLDNSCGGGAFLLAMLQRLMELTQSSLNDLDSPDGSVTIRGVDCGSTASVAAHVLKHRLFGADLDRGAVNITEAQLWLVTAALTGDLTGANTGMNLKTGDSLFPLWPEELVFDIIVGNPPYLRLSTLDPSYRTNLKARYKTAREYNIHALFIEASLQQLAPNGVLGYLVHKNLLTLGSYTQLRRRLLTNHRLKHISDCGPGVFRGVTAETGIIILRKGNMKRESSVSLSRYDPRREDCVSTTAIPQANYMNLVQPWNHRFLTGIDKVNEKLLSSLSNLPRLVDIASIHRGIETGCNDSFVHCSPKAGGNWKPVVRGRDIAAYRATSRVFLDYDRNRLAKPGRLGLLSMPKVIVQQNARNPVACYDEGKHLVLNSATYISEASRNVLKSICVFINSNLVARFFRTVMTNNARITVNLLPNNLGSIPIPESFDDLLYGKLCDVLTSLRSSEERSPSMNEVFHVWHSVIAEAAVQVAYFPDRKDSRSVAEELHTMLKDSLGLSNLLDISHKSLLTRSAMNGLEEASMLLLGKASR
ncbi:MAG: N-6 DNA methylase [Candidatus Thorarchaeota archaeon]|nr:MAG: N-6 DNA methylase [Candidatus Thorarchaeota archaeon]